MKALIIVHDYYQNDNPFPINMGYIASYLKHYGCELYYYAMDNGLLTSPGDFFNRFKNSDLITVNFTNMDDKYMYKQLYKANSILIDDYIKNTGNDVSYIKDSLRNLYFYGDTKFRGARHYDREESQ